MNMYTGVPKTSLSSLSVGEQQESCWHVEVVDVADID